MAASSSGLAKCSSDHPGRIVPLCSIQKTQGCPSDGINLGALSHPLNNLSLGHILSALRCGTRLPPGVFHKIHFDLVSTQVLAHDNC